LQFLSFFHKSNIFRFEKIRLSLDKIQDMRYNVIDSVSMPKSRMRVCACIKIRGKDMKTEKKTQSVRVALGVYLTIWTIAVGLMFILQIWALFRATDIKPYSVESVSRHFAKVAVPFWVWIAMVAISGLLAWAFPDGEEKPKAFVSVTKTLTRLKGRLPENAEGMVEVKRENGMRTVTWAVSFAMCAVSAVIAWKYLMNKEYVGELTSKFFQEHVIAEKLIKVSTWVFASLCTCVCALVYHSYSLNKELSMVKQMVADSAKRGEKPVVKEVKTGRLEKLKGRLAFLGSDRAKNITRIVLAVCGAVLVVVGIFNGGMASILEKAINICTQCIGLG